MLLVLFYPVRSIHKKIQENQDILSLFSNPENLLIFSYPIRSFPELMIRNISKHIHKYKCLLFYHSKYSKRILFVLIDIIYIREQNT